MSNKSMRIKTSTDEKFISVKLEQDVDMLEILSLKISQKDLYANFNANYGVLIGRVIANGGIGIPNAKICVFIPISEEDQSNPDIYALYPYKSTRDKNLDGIKFNLLPRVAVNNPFITEGEYRPTVPLGTFPTLPEIVTNPSYVEVYEKYYKYSTVTNTSGDYMIYGVPVGVQNVHLSVDVTDIGKFSMLPATMISQLGYSPNLFDNNGTKIKFTTDLETAPNIELQEVSVDVRPFWGDTENFEIGITRQDFKIKAVLASSFVVFGSAFSDGQFATRGFGDDDQSEDYWHMSDDANINVGISSKRNGKVNVDVLSLKPSVADSDAGSVDSLGIYQFGNFDTQSEVVVLSPQQYSSVIDNGQFAFIIPCNRRKIIINEFGEEIVVADDNPNGIFTEFRGSIIFRMDDPNLGITGGWSPKRVKFKFPQTAGESSTFKQPGSTPSADDDNEAWRRQHYKFRAGEFYIVSKFNALSHKSDGGTETVNDPGQDPFYNVGIIAVSASGDFPDNNPDYEYPSLVSNADYFGAEWINGSIYFEQYGNGRNLGQSGTAEVNTNMVYDDQSFYFIDDTGNNMLIGGTLRDTRYFMRSDRNKTTFVNMPKGDVIKIIEKTIAGSSPKGFRDNQAPYDTDPLTGNYPSTGARKYFYKGLDSADCFLFIRNLGLI